MHVFAGQRVWTLLALLGLLTHTPHAALAQPLALYFDEAQQRLLSVSDALASSMSQVENRRQLAEASRSLSYPEVSIDVRQLRFQKSLELPLGTLAPVAAAYGIPSPFFFKENDWRTRPQLTAVMPLWTGGQISAAQAAADAAVDAAQAQHNQTSQQESVQLVHAYFGQRLAQQVLLIREQVRDGLQQHHEKTQLLEREGFATQAQLLQVQVALDGAERDYLRAVNDLRGAQSALAGLLRSESTIEALTPLFVVQSPLEPVEQFIDDALRQHPGLAQLRAVGEQARQNVRAEEANWRPRVYAFSQYDLKRDDALLTDSDWAFGIGVSYTLFSNRDRQRQVGAARSQQSQAEFSLRDNAVKLEIAVTRAWLAADSARQQFMLLKSAVQSTEENLRLQNLSFEEGQNTTLDVIDARLQLGKTQIDQALAAWEFDVALIQLLDVSGQTQRFGDYLRHPDTVLLP
jgi:outer membrane protein TolC